MQFRMQIKYLFIWDLIELKKKLAKSMTIKMNANGVWVFLIFFSSLFVWSLIWSLHNNQQYNLTCKKLFSVLVQKDFCFFGWFAIRLKRNSIHFPIFRWWILVCLIFLLVLFCSLCENGVLVELNCNAVFVLHRFSECLLHLLQIDLCFFFVLFYVFIHKSLTTIE